MTRTRYAIACLLACYVWTAMLLVLARVVR